MVTEDYVSFEVAKLLKEKGFNERTICYYFLNGEIRQSMADAPWNNGVMEPIMICAPTLQMAMKWLREVHQLHISVDVAPIYGKVKNEKGRNTCGLLYWHYMASGEWMNEKYNPQQKAFVVSEKSHKQVVEASLKYTLNNLI